MLQVEKKAVVFVQRHIFWFGAAVAFVAAVLLRTALFPVASADYNMFLLPWYYEIIEGGGLPSLANHSANYNTAYLFLMYLSTLMPVEPIVGIKLFSFLGDTLMAFAAGLLVYQACGKIKKSVVAFLVVFLLPLTILNSAYWAQCDSIFTGFLLMALYWALRGKWPGMFVFVGIALCFKFQAIFFLPFLLIVYASTRKFTLFNFSIPPFILLISGLPAVLFGAPLYTALSTYMGQYENEQSVYVTYQGFATFFRWSQSEEVRSFLILCALTICALFFAVALYKKRRFEGDDLILLGAWSIFVCVLFLPGMHERYGYPGEIMLCVWFLRAPSVRRLLPTLALYFVGFMSSARFLLGAGPDGSVYIAMVGLAAFVYITWLLLFPQSGQKSLKDALKPL